MFIFVMEILIFTYMTLKNTNYKIENIERRNET